MSEREFITEPQPIADQLMVKCPCGWRQAISFHEFGTRDAIWAAARRAFKAHQCAN